MSTPGRPKGEFRSAEHEGTLMNSPLCPKASTAVRSTGLAR
jgi:hypothetical protein